MRIAMPVTVRMPSVRAPALQTAHMAQAFSELGNEVTVFSPAPPLAHELPNGWSAAEVGDAARAETLLGYRPDFRIVHGARRVRRGQSLTNSLRIAHFARPRDVDLVVSRDLRGAVLPAIRGVPTVLEVHALSTLGPTPDRVALRLLRASPGYRGLIAISDPLRDDLVELHGLDPSEVLVAADAVRIVDPAPPGSTSDATAGAIAGAGAGRRPRIGYTGSLYPGKGVETVVALARRCPWADFHVAGGPAQLVDELRRTADAERINLVIHGLLPQPETLALQRSCDVLVAPFGPVVRSDSGVDIARWTSPLKVFEYLASGRPSVIGDLASLRGVLTDGVEALLVAPGDVDAFAAALERLRDEPELAAGIARDGYLAASTRWTWAARARNILERFAPEAP